MLGKTLNFLVEVGAQGLATLRLGACVVNGHLAACAKVAVDHAGSKTESRKSLGAYLDKEVEGFAEHPERDDLLQSLWEFTEELADLIRSKENSIWAFIVRNGYRPAMLRSRFDFIVGNPPWLSYR